MPAGVREVRGDFRQRVAVEVRAWMTRRGVTVAQLAEAMSATPGPQVSRAWVSRRLQGDTALDTDDLERIAAVLDVPLPTLLQLPLELAAQVDAPAPPSPRRRRSAAHRTRGLQADVPASAGAETGTGHASGINCT